MKFDRNGKAVEIEPILEKLLGSFPEVDPKSVSFNFVIKNENISASVTDNFWRRSFSINAIMPNAIKGKFDYEKLVEGIGAHELSHIANGDLYIPRVYLNGAALYFYNRNKLPKLVNLTVENMERRADALSIERGFAKQAFYTLSIIKKLGVNPDSYQGRLFYLEIHSRRNKSA